MDGHESLAVVEEMTSPPSPKRPRPDHTEDNGKRRFDFPQLLTFQKPVSLQQNTSQVCSEYLPLQTRNDQDQQNFHHFGKDLTMQTSQASILFITDVTETDRLILNMLYDSHGAAVASHDCSRLGKSFQCVPPVGFSLARGDMEVERQVRNSGTHIQIVTLARAEEDVRCQSDCSYEEAPFDGGTDMQNGPLATAEVSNQGEIQYEFSEKSPCNKKLEQERKDLCFSPFGDSKSFSAKPVVCPSSSLAEVGENDGETLELQNVASCEVKTEEQFNEGRKQSFAAAGEQAEGTAIENMNKFYAIDKFEARKEETAKELSTKVGIETTHDATETQTSVSISQVITEGDNDAASFSVIDPAKWSGADSPAVEKRNAELELSASEKVCKEDKNVDTKALQGEMIHLSGPEQTGQLPFQSLEQQPCEYEEDCQSHTEAVTCIAHDKASDKSDTENRWRHTSPCSVGSAIFDSAEDQRGGSQGIVGDELKGRDQSGSLSGSLDHTEAHVDERPQGFMATADQTTVKREMAGLVSMNENRLLGEVATQQNLFKVTIDNSQRDCSSQVTSEIDLAVFADNQLTSCKVAEVKTCKEAAIEVRDAKNVMNKQEATSVASEQLECNMAEVQRTVLNIFEVEASEMMDSKGNEVKEDPSEQLQRKNVLEEDKANEAEENHTTYNGLIEDIVGAVEIATVREKSPQHNGDPCTTTLSERCQSVCNTLKPVVVPGISSFGTSSLHTDQSFMVLYNCNGRFSPAPSAFPLTKRAPIGGFDTFEKIQLSPDDNDMDAPALGNSPLLTSPPRQLLENPQVYLSKSHAANHESDKTEEIELSNANECGFLSNQNTCNKVPSPISAADVIARGWPEQKPLCESAFQIYDCFQDDSNLDSSAVSFESDFSDCDGSDRREFEMKTQFDSVLKELKLFFDISASDMASSNDTSSPEPLREITEALEGETSKCKEPEESPEEQNASVTALDDPDEDTSLECEGGAVGAKTHEGEQEVPLSSCELHEAPTRNQLKDTEAGETEQRRRMWSPSFMSLPLVEQLTQKLLEPQRRLEPLRTCSRPIRVGLSKRAKTRQLHHPHSYK
ncbi:hypothetical protein WMY93_015983 [Mugilogobius chulae]|uniref:Uncharacterized protein n=1 Tax=Mugilogobius chulae TaxID=88201 RepID=A0AAW0P2K1_9GOBI